MMPTVRAICLAALLALALALPRGLHAQAGASTDIVRGTVTDTSGAPVQGAQVQVTSIETSVTKNTTTDSHGRYMIVWVDGGGRYRVVARAIGYRPVTSLVARGGDEDVLVANLRMGGVPVQLPDLTVRSQTPPPAGADPGAETSMLPSVLMSRLPLEGRDPTDLVALTPNAVTTPASRTDSTEGEQQFSIGGARTALNRITLDGLSLGSQLTGGRAGGAAPWSVPPEAIRGTQVIVSSYDVSRGGFAGGQVASMSQRGGNLRSGTFSMRLIAEQLQSGFGGATGPAPYNMQELSGGIGGPIKRDKIHYFLSAALQHRVDYPFAMSSGRGSQVFGNVSPDTIARFLAIADTVYHVPTATDTGAYHRPADALSGLARLDFNLGRHVLFVRAHNTWYQNSNTRISPFDLTQNGGEAGSRSRGVFAGATSQLGGGWLNEFRVQYVYEGRPTRRFYDVPQGSVRVASALPDGSVGITTLTFGGERTLPTAQDERRFEITDELSLIWHETHRLKTGAYFNYNDFTQQTDGNRLGTFVFNSLDDFQAGRAAAFTRTLNATPTTGSGWNAAAYLGDAWRPRDWLQLVYGVRYEVDGYLRQPRYNPALDSALGLRTDRLGARGMLSPRLGFTWRLNRPREMTPEEMVRMFAREMGRAGGGMMMIGGGMMMMGGGPGPGGPPAQGQAQGQRPRFDQLNEMQRELLIDSILAVIRRDTVMYNRLRQATLRIAEVQTTSTLRGGVGMFRGPAPLGLYAASLGSTGFSNGVTQLVCTGSSVPAPDYDAYEQDAASIPEECAGPASPLLNARPLVATFAPSFAAPVTTRATLGLQKPLTRWLQFYFDVMGSWGSRLYVARDVNLDTVPRFALAAEGGRPVYVPPPAISPFSGQIQPQASRVDTAFGHVLVLESTGRSWNYSLSPRLIGRIGRVTLTANYTLAWSHDQSSFSCCNALQAFAQPTTAGNPNALPMSPSMMDRRHSLALTALVALPFDFQASVVGTIGSGTPYTPVVQGDINGDGVSNDRAFVFDPRTTTDTALANAMTRVLANAPANARDCLERQLGRVAARNSCRSGWYSTLNLRVTGRPPVGQLQRRMEISLDFLNLLGGLDRLFHGDNPRGWGALNQVFGNEPLLYVRGFDPATHEFRYQVNEAFGRPRFAAFGFTNPFQVQMSVRYVMGAGFFGAGGPGVQVGGPGGASGQGPRR